MEAAKIKKETRDSFQWSHNLFKNQYKSERLKLPTL